MNEMWNWQGPDSALAVVILTVFFTGGLLVLALWIALPVAVLSLRSALREVAAAQRAANDELAGIRRSLEGLAPRREADPVPETPSDRAD